MNSSICNQYFTVRMNLLVFILLVTLMFRIEIWQNLFFDWIYPGCNWLKIANVNANYSYRHIQFIAQQFLKYTNIKEGYISAADFAALNMFILNFQCISEEKMKTKQSEYIDWEYGKTNERNSNGRREWARGQRDVVLSIQFKIECNEIMSGMNGFVTLTNLTFGR